MCVIIYKQSQLKVTKEILETCWRKNNDGAGIMFAEGGKIHIFKELKSFDKFFELYTKFEDRDLLMHFRIATSGKVNETNCHPFVVNKNLAVMHNGMIDIKSSAKYSDTWHFTRLLQGFKPNFLSDAYMVNFIEDYIGYSKLTFMDNKGNVTIINEQMGTWDEGIWYSNTSYKTSYYDYGGVSKYSGDGYYGSGYGVRDYEYYDGYDDFLDTRKNKGVDINAEEKPNNSQMGDSYFCWECDDYFPYDEFDHNNQVCNCCYDAYAKAMNDIIDE